MGRDFPIKVTHCRNVRKIPDPSKSSSKALAHFGLEIILLTSINKPLRDRSCDYRACHWVQSSMTYSRFLVNVCFVIDSLSRRFVMMCWSAASLQLCLFSVSHWVYNLMQIHAIPYPLVGFVHAFQVRICTCISRSREHKYPNYVPLGRKINCPYSCTHEDIREFESNNSLQCCHEVRIGKQNVHAYKIYSGKEKKMYTWACKLSDLQVSELPSPSLQFI